MYGSPLGSKVSRHGLGLVSVLGIVTTLWGSIPHILHANYAFYIVYRIPLSGRIIRSSHELTPK